MSISLFPLGEPAIAQVDQAASMNKAPPKRQAVALADRVAMPEPR